MLLHTVIEAIDPASSGYRLGRVQRLGAHLAVEMLAKSRVVAFSKVISDSLKQEYGHPPDLVFPIPCNDDVPVSPSQVAPRIVVIPGYISPYKNISLLPELKEAVGAAARFIVVGGPHRVLEGSAAYRARFESIQSALRSAGIEQSGYLPEAEFTELIRTATVGLLPYLTTQGGSAAFSRLASAGKPVVAPSLPEFNWLKQLGAGLLLTDPSPDSLGAGVLQLLNNPDLYKELQSKQLKFRTRYSWSNFTTELFSVCRTNSGGATPIPSERLRC